MGTQLTLCIWLLVVVAALALAAHLRARDTRAERRHRELLAALGGLGREAVAVAVGPDSSRGKLATGEYAVARRVSRLTELQRDQVAEGLLGGRACSPRGLATELGYAVEIDSAMPAELPVQLLAGVILARNDRHALLTGVAQAAILARGLPSMPADVEAVVARLSRPRAVRGVS